MDVLPFVFYVVSVVLLVLVVFILVFVFSYIMALLDVIGRSINNFSIASSSCKDGKEASGNCFLFRMISGFIKDFIGDSVNYYNIGLKISRFLGLIIILSFVVLALSIYVTAKQVEWKLKVLDKVIIGIFFVLFAALVALIPIMFSKVKTYTDQILNVCGTASYTDNTPLYCPLISYIPSISDSMLISSIVLISASFLIYVITFSAVLISRRGRFTKEAEMKTF